MMRFPFTPTPESPPNSPASSTALVPERSRVRRAGAGSSVWPSRSAPSWSGPLVVCGDDHVFWRLDELVHLSGGLSVALATDACLPAGTRRVRALVVGAGP
jgi:hypothetical protein